MDRNTTAHAFPSCTAKIPLFYRQFTPKECYLVPESKSAKG